MDITIILSFLLAQSITQNKQAGITTSLGLCSGLLVHISATTLGISALLYQSSFAFLIVTAGQLTYFSWHMKLLKIADPQLNS
ncbi:hypothetical protein [Guptibacillus hwajinpoensis]|uniref:hypothetical protein n=1 Tax=Guptibacillus hwajinpoensis TaxID=208199 RepID=UPI001CFD6E8C|nr:hypothetical protein [Pseudalkalibacillus hwajinpoensis]WLR60382.1 hypothetical protein LC071_03140 [Pseudalkalibacillus hwajinpoensis]